LGLKLLKPKFVVWDIEFVPREINDFNSDVVAFTKLYREIKSIGTFSLENDEYKSSCSDNEYATLSKNIGEAIKLYLLENNAAGLIDLTDEKKEMSKIFNNCLYKFTEKTLEQFKTKNFKEYLNFLTNGTVNKIIEDMVKSDTRAMSLKEKVNANTMAVMDKMFSQTGSALKIVYLVFAKVNVISAMYSYSKSVNIKNTISVENFSSVNDISHIILPGSYNIGFANTPAGKYGKVRDIPIVYTLNGNNLLHLSVSAYVAYKNYSDVIIRDNGISFGKNGEIEEIVPVNNNKLLVDFLDYERKKYDFLDAAHLIYLGRAYDEILYNIATNYDALVSGVQEPLIEAGLLKEKVLKRSIISGKLHPIKFYKYVKRFAGTFKKVMMDLIAAGGSQEDIENYKQILLLASDIESNKLEKFIDLYKKLFKKVNKKVVFVGGVKRGADMKNATLGSNYPGVLVHLSSFNKLVKKSHLKQLNKVGEYCIMLMLLLLSCYLLTKYGSILCSIFVVIVLVSLFFIKVELLNKGMYMSYSDGILLLLMPSAVSVAIKERVEGRAKKMLKQTFQNFISKEVLDYLLLHPDKIKLGGEMKEATVFFSDLSGFTTFSEKYRPEYVITILNEYLKIITDKILENKGFLDKYEGDGVMAAFGVPIEFAQSAVCACNAAVDIKNNINEIQEEWEGKGLPFLKIRIGLSTGQIIAGNIGSEKRLDYTLIGDYVNLANRLEQSNKAFGTSIMIEENTYNKVKEYFHCRKIGLIKVKGKEKFVSVYELIDRKANPDVDTNFLRLFNEAVELYLTKNVVEAKYIFEKLLKMDETDKAVRKYLDLCNELIKKEAVSEEDLVIRLG
ncbi:MAG: adenylate/guanylate cyclase domain-containing protein, partial [Candidatus Pacearchaeota archaeon]